MDEERIADLERQVAELRRQLDAIADSAFHRLVDHAAARRMEYRDQGQPDRRRGGHLRVIG